MCVCVWYAASTSTVWGGKRRRISDRRDIRNPDPMPHAGLMCRGPTNHSPRPGGNGPVVLSSWIAESDAPPIPPIFTHQHPPVQRKRTHSPGEGGSRPAVCSAEWALVSRGRAVSRDGAAPPLGDATVSSPLWCRKECAQHAPCLPHGSGMINHPGCEAGGRAGANHRLSAWM